MSPLARRFDHSRLQRCSGGAATRRHRRRPHRSAAAAARSAVAGGSSTASRLLAALMRNCSSRTDHRARLHRHGSSAGMLIERPAADDRRTATTHSSAARGLLRVASRLAASWYASPGHGPSARNTPSYSSSVPFTKCTFLVASDVAGAIQVVLGLGLDQPPLRLRATDRAALRLCLLRTRLAPTRAGRGWRPSRL